jgi:hypothetical protein
MAFLLNFLHIVRLSMIPIIFVKIRELQQGKPKSHEEGG